MFNTEPKPLHLTCDVCVGAMDLFVTIPAVLKLPEILRFRCRSCGCYKTVEHHTAEVSGRAA